MYGKKTIARFWNIYKDRGIKSIVIALVTWFLAGVITYFTIQDLLPLRGIFSSWDAVLDGVKLVQTLLLEGVMLLLMIYPMCEYLFSFHIVADINDRYKWYIPVIVMGCITVFFFMAGCINIIQLIGMAVIILVPRLVYSLQPN